MTKNEAPKSSDAAPVTASNPDPAKDAPRTEVKSPEQALVEVEGKDEKGHQGSHK